MRPDISISEALQACSEEQPENIAVDDLFCQDIVHYWSENKDLLDQAIERQLTKSWSLNRLDRVLYSIMQAGAAELYALQKVDAALTVTEYLDVTHAFFQGDEHKIVNGVLHAVAQNR